jgi:hypothetical protein
MCFRRFTITRANTKKALVLHVPLVRDSLFRSRKQTHPERKSFHDMPNNELIRTRAAFCSSPGKRGCKNAFSQRKSKQQQQVSLSALASLMYTESNVSVRRRRSTGGLFTIQALHF